MGDTRVWGSVRAGARLDHKRVRAERPRRSMKAAGRQNEDPQPPTGSLLENHPGQWTSTEAVWEPLKPS
jgi:hypothetical protein